MQKHPVPTDENTSIQPPRLQPNNAPDSRLDHDINSNQQPLISVDSPPQSVKRLLDTDVTDPDRVSSTRLNLVTKRRRKTVVDSTSKDSPTKEVDDHLSPLFFSSKHLERPQLLPRFSSSEAGQRMLSKVQGEESTVKTVTLARGSYSEHGGQSPGFLTSKSRTHSDRSNPAGNASPIDRTDPRNASRILSSIGIHELFEEDSRPTFVIDVLNPLHDSNGAINPVFINAALRSNSFLLSLIRLEQSTTPTPYPKQPENLSSFHDWILSNQQLTNTVKSSSSFTFANVLWTFTTVRKRLRIVSGILKVEQVPSNTAHHDFVTDKTNKTASPQSLGPREAEKDYFGDVSSSQSETKTGIIANHESTFDKSQAIVLEKNYDSGGDEIKHTASLDVGFFDWTRLPDSADLPSHIRFAKSVDWSATSLGPMEYWSADLRQMCNLIMASPHPAAMYWGDELSAIYNEAYVLLAGAKHPALMGQSYKEAWAEIWDAVKGAFDNARSTGQATMKDDDMLFMNRTNYLEETYFSWAIIPIVSADGTVCGLYNPAFEKTRRKIAERRMLTLREVGERTALARNVKMFWKEVEDALDTNPWDTPFLLLYSVNSYDVDCDSEATASVYSSSVGGSNKQCNLEGVLGVSEGHMCAPKQVDLRGGTEGFGPIFQEALKDGIVIVRVVDDLNDPQQKPSVEGFAADPEDLSHASKLEIKSSMLKGIDWRGFGDPVRSVVVCPVQPTADSAFDPLGFIVVGINPRRPFDEDYSLFVQLLSRQLATSLASVVLFEEEIKRGQKAAELAALDRIQLSQQLAARTQEARDSEQRFTHMANASPAGLFIADSKGHITYCNDTWYEIAGVPKDVNATNNWMEYVKGSDQEYVRSLWTSLVHNATDVHAEFRFKTQWHDGNGNTSDTWVLFIAHPETRLGVSGSVTKSVFGNITNISSQKWAQGFQKRKMEEAVELKRQQENFIDSTSHEIRNPLGVILISADEISSSLYDINTTSFNKDDEERIKDSISAAETIVLCAQHQKRIVDDILTLSKLDSHMLMVAPVDVQPLIIIQRVLKMFQAETHNAGIDLTLKVDDSFKNLKVNWVKLDPQRVGQVLINLMTNAIKFTSNKAMGGGAISVTLSAANQRPSQTPDSKVQYFPSRIAPDENLLSGSDWGDGEELYIAFAVKDTGPGLQDEDLKILFNRFTQASPRTHVHYGGSGLGLFISRELAELQGGEIGVSSEAGKGSTFGFYIKSRRSSEPADPDVGIPANLKNVDVIGRRSENALSTSQLSKRNEVSILIVEDNLVNQRVLQKQLRNLGYTVHVANHGGEALDAIRKSKFWKGAKGDVLDLRVVLMDQEMPVLSGMEATKTIRQWEMQGDLTRHVPIIGVTANARREQIDDLIQAGMDDVVSKPFRLPELLPKVEELAAKYSPSRN